MTTGERIRELRIERGWTQEEFAIKCGYANKSAISKIESAGDNVSLGKVKKISNALNVPPSRLMGWEDEEEIKDTTYNTGHYLAQNPKRALEVLEMFIPMSDEEYDAIMHMVKTLKKDEG